MGRTEEYKYCERCNSPMFRKFGATGWGKWTHYSNGTTNCFLIVPPRDLFPAEHDPAKTND